nr:hypothetical protein [Tanacetum cinerariifolium]
MEVSYLHYTTMYECLENIMEQPSEECGKFYKVLYVSTVPTIDDQSTSTAGVDVDVIPAAAAEPSIPSPTPTTQPPPPPPSQELPSTSQVIPAPPPSPIAKPSSPPQQQQPSQPTYDAEISLDLLHTLLETCIILTRKVEALEQDKVAQALEIIMLKQRVKKLERKDKLKVSGLRRLRKDAAEPAQPSPTPPPPQELPSISHVGTAQRVKSSTDTVIDDQEDTSKQKGIIANLDADKDATLEDVNAGKDAEAADDVANVADDDVDDVVAEDAAEPAQPSPTPPPPQELPSISHVAPTPPLSPIAQPLSPPQQQ